jgi:hypothetical protein
MIKHYFFYRSREIIFLKNYIIYDQSNKDDSGAYVPFIAIMDLLGRFPVYGEILDLEIDLKNVPIRYKHS